MSSQAPQLAFDPSSGEVIQVGSRQFHDAVRRAGGIREFERLNWMIIDQIRQSQAMQGVQGGSQRGNQATQGPQRSKRSPTIPIPTTHYPNQALSFHPSNQGNQGAFVTSSSIVNPHYSQEFKQGSIRQSPRFLHHPPLPPTPRRSPSLKPPSPMATNFEGEEIESTGSEAGEGERPNRFSMRGLLQSMKSIFSGDGNNEGEEEEEGMF